LPPRPSWGSIGYRNRGEGYFGGKGGTFSPPTIQPVREETALGIGLFLRIWINFTVWHNPNDTILPSQFEYQGNARGRDAPEFLGDLRNNSSKDFIM
jgi:hypothetical protein